MVIVPGAAGYVVLEPNFRGSTGYGEHFRNLNVEDSGGGEIEDIGAAVNYLVNAGLADPKRVAIAVTKLPGTFAAGIEMFGVVDRGLFLQHTTRNSRISVGDEDGWDSRRRNPRSIRKRTCYRR
jgi:dipeptidyl aminopeptidase/acylaminoacyl peptidase